MSPLDGDVAIVTGAAGELGHAIADALERDGASVARTDIRGAELSLDVTDRASIEAAIVQVVETLGEPTVLVNNAGVIPVAPSAVQHDSVWRAAIDVNLTGAYLCSQVVGARMLRSSRGSIVNIASVAALLGVPGSAAYCASKAGLVGLTRALGAEWARYGVRVNAVCPGFLRTAAAEEAANLGVIELEEIAKRTPTARIPELTEIADAVSFLASRAAAGLNGHSMVVDGGFAINGAVSMDAARLGSGRRRSRGESAPETPDTHSR